MSSDNSEAVAEFIRTRGITRCPTACVLPTQALIDPADRAALEEHAMGRDRLSRARAANNWGNPSNPKTQRRGAAVTMLESGGLKPIRSNERRYRGFVVS